MHMGKNHHFLWAKIYSHRVMISNSMTVSNKIDSLLIRFSGAHSHAWKRDKSRIDMLKSLNCLLNLPYQAIQIRVISVGIHIRKIAAHR